MQLLNEKRAFYATLYMWTKCETMWDILLLCQCHTCSWCFKISFKNVLAELWSTENSTCSFKQVRNILTLKVRREVIYGWGETTNICIIYFFKQSLTVFWDGILSLSCAVSLSTAPFQLYLNVYSIQFWNSEEHLRYPIM